MFQLWFRFNFLFLAWVSRLLVILLAEAKEVSAVLVLFGVGLDLRQVSVLFGLSRLFILVVNYDRALVALCLFLASL